jgi:hypothetical protein
MNVQDQLKTIEVSALLSCIASICHVYMKFPLKIKDSTFFLIVLENIYIVRQSGSDLIPNMIIFANMN